MNTSGYTRMHCTSCESLFTTTYDGIYSHSKLSVHTKTVNILTSRTKSNITAKLVIYNMIMIITRIGGN